MTKTARTSTARAANPTSKPAADTDMHEEIIKRYVDAQDAFLGFFKAPSWKRALCGLVAACLASFGLGYLGGTVLSWMVAGALMMATPLWIVMTLYVIGMLLVIWKAGSIGMRIFGAVLTHEADERAVAAYDATKNFFSRINPFAGREEKVAPVVAARGRTLRTKAA